METIDLTEAAALLHMSEDALMRKARAGIVPGDKPGRQWVFVKDDLLAWIRERAKARACRSIAAPTLRTGGVDSRSTTERSASQLAREIRAKRRNLKPQLALVPGGK
ncbi:MAG TPA: helix-turn-helix domain-containing protein [Gammaproteobacteria bacterium]|nr:helix-turn-helix domain-containing protein [Gammaproteobacteria bacterium]